MQSLRTLSRAALLLAILGSPAAGLAQEHGEAESSSHGHGFHKNVFGGYIGITGEDAGRGDTGRERAITLGFEYERRFSESLGLGLAAERAYGELDFWVVTVPLVIHNGPWIWSVGPGIEIPVHDGEDEFVFRVSGGYAFKRNGYEIAPKLGVDYVADEFIGLAGVVVAFGF